MINKRFFTIAVMVFFFASLGAYAQLRPQDAIKSMMRGINLGNTLEPPNEGDWGNTASEANFDDYRNAGFTCVRIPVTWHGHTSATSPYTINATWLNRVEQVVDWALSKKLIVILNAHHEAWIKDAYSEANMERFDSIWSQIAVRFRNKSDSLLFEMINEPNPMEMDDVDTVNARILRTIRKTNPTRIVLFSGYRWSNAEELVTAAIPNDTNLIGYYHSYDPYPFGLEGTGSYGTDADIASTEARFTRVSEWSAAHNIPVVLGEFAYHVNCEYNSRMCAYATVMEKGLTHNVACLVWDDGGWYRIYNRSQHTWSEVKDILMHTYPESPNRLRISNIADTLVRLQWNNRTTGIDSIVIQRKVNTGSFTYFRTVSDTTDEFIDSTTSRGVTYYYRLSAMLNDTTEMQSYPVRIVNVPVNPQPYTGVAVVIPGTLEAEQFDIGIEGQTYHDSEAGNNGGEYRPGAGVDIYSKTTTYYLSDVEAGEWLDFSINVTQEGEYKIIAYVGAESDGGEFELQFENDSVASFVIAATGSLTSFKQLTATCYLEAGLQKVRLLIIQKPAFTINKIAFSEMIPSIVNSNATPDGFSVFPNPAGNQVYISGIQFPVRVEIYAVNGSLLRTVELKDQDNTVSLDDMKDGLYTIKCTNKDGSWSKKLIIRND